jgi:hypothetical protein
MRRYDVLQLADVAGPWVFGQVDESLRRKLLLPPVPGVEAGQELAGQRQDLLPPFPQRRDAEIHDVDAVIEVFAELAPGHRALEVAVGGGDDPGVDRDRAVTANAGEAEILEDVQQLRLQRQRQLGDLVQADRAAARALEQSELAPVRAREGPALVAEQLRFQELGGDGRAVDLDEGTRAPGRARVDGAADEVLADPALAANEDRRVRVSDELDEAPDRAHRWAVSERTDRLLALSDSVGPHGHLLRVSPTPERLVGAHEKPMSLR